MTTEQDIKKIIVNRLKAAKYTVPASETKEGFNKPAVFVTVYPSSITRINTDLEQVTDSVEIRYYPRNETNEECALTAQKMRKLFMYSTLDISDRHFTIETMDLEIEDRVLYVFFDLEYTHAIEQDDDYDIAEILEMEGA